MLAHSSNSAKEIPSTDEIEELLLQELETLFDKPCLIPIQNQKEDQSRPSSGISSSAKQSDTPTSFKIGFEKDFTNTFLITNPSAIFKVFTKEQFLALPEASQCLLLERLDDILQKCSHNAHILTDHMVLTNVTRLNQQTINGLVNPNNIEENDEETMRNTTTKNNVPEYDILMLMIQLCLKVSNRNPNSTKKLIELIKKLSFGRRFQKCHLEFIYQYLKLKSESLCKKGKCPAALVKLNSSIKLIQGLFEQRFDLGPQNYFYFSGFLSGIQGFAAAMWFQVQEQILQDDRNLPVLFNCFIQGNGGFECYFNQRKLYYRILSKLYVPPSIESNGILIGEFLPKKWYFFSIEHEKPFMTRPQVTAIINDKQVVTLPMDYPKIEKNAKVTMIAICKNFVGQMSSFMLFKEQVNNAKKMIQMYMAYEYGLHSSTQINKLNSDIFDSKLTDKLYIVYTPEKTFNKNVYDCIEMRDAELMVNSGVSCLGPKQKLFFCGGMNSLLPLMDLLRGIINFRKEERHLLPNIDLIVNDFLRLINQIVSTKSYSVFESENSNFFSILFHLLTSLPPKQAANSETIQLLAEIRFQIGDSKLQEQFFTNLMYSSDFWINSDNVEVINEYWLFVKAIYSQNTVQYNKIFSIQNLIDLMVKISEIKDGGYCCEYHKNTYMMFYQGQLQGQTLTGTQLLQSKFVEESKDDTRQQLGASGVIDKVEYKKNYKTHQIDKFLSPIAGVLEGVLTSGGNEVLDQIQYIAKALTVKSSPCFHLQMLKLLKVLLLDSKEDRHCASPGDFAEHLLKAKGLQILLYLCSNSSFDVKSMCVKLIDVLSSHTNLIKMAIDPDVITYLCNIILPRSMMEQASITQKNSMFKTNIGSSELKNIDNQQTLGGGQYLLVEDNEEELNKDSEQAFLDSQPLTKLDDQDDDDFDEAQFQEMVRKKNMGKDGKPLKKQFKGLFIDDEEEEQEDKFKQDPYNDDVDLESEIIVSKKSKNQFSDQKKRVSIGNFQEEENDDDYDPLFSQQKKPQKQAQQNFNMDEMEEIGGRPPPPAPKNRQKQMKFDFDSDPKDNKTKFNQTSKAGGFFGKNSKPKLFSEIIEDDEEMKSEKSGGEGEDSLSNLDFGVGGLPGPNNTADKRKMFMNTQKLPSLKGKSSGNSFARNKGLELQFIDDQSQIKEPKKKTQLFADEETIQNAENDEFSQDLRQKGNKLKNKSPTSFANENVMSKSNLRQPKSFMFDDSGSDEEEEKLPNQEQIKNLEDDEFVLDLKPQVKQNPFSQAAKRGNLLSKRGGFGGTSIGQRKKPTLTISDSQEDIVLEDSSNTQSEETILEPPQGKKKMLVGGTTGATSETHYEPRSQSRERTPQQPTASTQQSKKKTPISFKEKSKLFSNTNAKLNIDTDAINEEFNYGGEKGQKQMTEDEELENLEQEIEELANLCIAAMKRMSPNDPIEYEVSDMKKVKPTFENKYLNKGPQGPQTTKNAKASFMVPQSVRGIKKIDIQSTQEEKNAILEGSAKEKLSLGGTFGAGTKGFNGLKSIAEEEISPLNTNKSSSGQHDFNFGLNTVSSDILDGLQNAKKPRFQTTAHSMTFAGNNLLSTQKRESSDLQIEFHNQELIQSQNEHTLQNASALDEYTVELENLYTSCLEWIISRAPSSLYENIVIDDCDKIGYQPAIQLLMTLVTYSNNLVRQKALQDLLMLAQWDSNNGTQIMVHPQFHSWLLEILLPYQDISNKYSQSFYGNSLAVYDIGCKLHTLLLKNACTNCEEEAYKKINFLARWPSILQLQADQGIKGRNDKDVEVANKLVRVLFYQLVLSLKEDARARKEISRVQVTWHNLIYSINLVEEMVVSSVKKEMESKDNQSRDVNVSLLKWVQKDYLLYYYGSNEKSLWAEWDLLDSVFQVIDTIYPDWLTKRANQKLSLEEQIYNTLHKSSPDEFNSIVEILVHDCSPYKAQGQGQGQTNTYNITKPKQQKVKNVIANVINNVAPLRQKHQEQPQQQNTANENSFMRNIINLLCIALTQSDTKQLVQLWLERFEKFIKYIMIVSEVWKSRLVSTLYAAHQKKFSDIITFAFSFLFHEIHATNRPTATTPSNNSSQQTAFSNPNMSGLYQSSQSQSPKDQQFNKMYAQSLKNLMIYFINIIEYAKMKNTPMQLESHVTACRNIFNNVLIIRETLGQVENLISLRDISRLKSSDYDDFPECFYLDDWKVTFFTSDVINKVIKSQLNVNILWEYTKKRIQYSQHYLETQLSNDKTKDDILKRMQCDTVEVIGTLSEIEFERKNKVALMNDNFQREQGYSWKTAKKLLFGNRGIWKPLGQQFLKTNLYRIGDGVKAVMGSRPNNGFILQDEKEQDLEKKIFKELINSSCSILNEQIEEASNLIMSPVKVLTQIPDKKKKIKPSFNSDDEEEEEEDEDEQIIELQQNELSIQEQPVIQFFSKPLTQREKISLKKQYITHLKEHISTFRPKIKELLELKCSLLKPLYQRLGTLYLTANDIIFFDDLYTPISNEKDNIFFFKYQKKQNDLLYKIIPLNTLKEIQKRRFLGKNAALEVFLTDSNSILFNFNSTEDREQFAKKIVRQRKKKCYNLKYYDTLDAKKMLKKRELTESWMQWKISNFEYIMQLNMLSGRSYNDLSQYPVFPWVIVDYSSKNPPDLNAFNPIAGGAAPNGFRDLNKNMMLLGSAERQAEFKRKYDDDDSFANVDEKYHCGSHYSNPGIVLHYLARVSPYIDALVDLHGKSMDKADRAFHSIQDSLSSALTDYSDVRELIPEFYFCPEMYLNLNNINFGTKQDGVVVNNVILPEWCNNDPYLFCIFQREAFETNYVSQNIAGWVDYIFGFKQRNPEAEKCLNLYSNITYEDGIDIDSISDELQKKSYQEQIYNYGQTPSQLFQKSKHPSRLNKHQAIKFCSIVDSSSKIKVYKPVVQLSAATQRQMQQSQNQLLLTNEAILKAKFVDDQTIIGLSKDGTLTYFFWLSKAHELNPQTPFTCCEDKKRKYDVKTKQYGIDQYDRSIKKFDFPLLILNSLKCVLRGGFWGGKIVISPIDQVSNDQPSTLVAHQSTVTAMACSQNEKTVITGSKSGDVIVWQYIGTASTNISNESNWQIRKHICDHEGQIGLIHINEEMAMYATCSFDGTCNLYNFGNDKLFRSFSHPKLAPIHSVVLSQSPLPAICFFSREDHYWYSFSLNGKLLERQKEEFSHIIGPQVIRDSHFMDKLVYGTEKGYLIFRQLPLLKQIKKQQVSANYPVLTVIVSPDRRFLLVGCGDGGLNVITEPFQPQTTANSQAQQTQQIMRQGSFQSTLQTGSTLQQMTLSSSETSSAFRE